MEVLKENYLVPVLGVLFKGPVAFVFMPKQVNVV
jgi:hypothetical protein